MNSEKTISYAERVSQVPVSFVREILKVAADPSMVSFAGGLPNPACFPIQELGECTNKVFRDQGGPALQYAPTEGYLPLREFIAARYSERFGMEVQPAQILITNGSQQALDLIGKLFINPGDNVLLERPCYLGALQCFSMFQPQFKEVKLLDDGPDTNELESRLEEDDVKLFYTIPNFQNPSGIQYSLEKRQRIAGIIARKSTLLIEDDPYGEISFRGNDLPPLFSLLPQQTILLGSFSKIIAPGLRLGWMLASEDIIRQATVIKQASDLHSGNVNQYILYEFLKSYGLTKHLSRLVPVYREQRDVMMECLNLYFPPSISFTVPEGGMFTWLRLPDFISAKDLLNRAIKENIIFVPGDSFYAKNPDGQTLRLNYSNVDSVKMRKAMQNLAALIDLNHS